MAGPDIDRTPSGRPAKSGLGRVVYDWGKVFVIAISIALCLRWTVGEPYRIPTSSMEPTLHGDERIGRGDRVFVNKWIHGLRVPFINKRIWDGQEPQRWDIVVFRSAEAETARKVLVKRIVGLPGERIHIADGKVYADDKELTPPASMGEVEYTAPDAPAALLALSTEAPKYGVIDQDEYALVPEGHYLVLGDNSANSRDGRVFGWLPNENILGRVAAIWWPPQRWRDFTGFSRTWWWRSAVFLILVCVLLRLFLWRSWRHRTGAIDTPLDDGEHLLINHLIAGPLLPGTRWHMFKGRLMGRGDLVLYKLPEDVALQPPYRLAWVAGLPGERVQLVDEHLEINGNRLAASSHMAARVFPSQGTAGAYGRSKSKNRSLVPQDHYYLLVDKPELADDSRTYGWIPQEDVIGRVVAVWWPLRKIQRFKP